MYKWIHPPKKDLNRKHCLTNLENSLVGCMEINPMVGTQCKVTEMEADISSGKMYFHLRKLDNNNVYNSNYNREKVNFSPSQLVFICMSSVVSPITT